MPIGASRNISLVPTGSAGLGWAVAGAACGAWEMLASLGGEPPRGLLVGQRTHRGNDLQARRDLERFLARHAFRGAFVRR